MNLRPVAAALFLLAALPGGIDAADRPVVRVASVSQEIVPWCLMSGFIYQPGFVPVAPAPNADFETVLLSPAQAVVAVESGELALDECVGLGTIVQAWKQGARNVSIVAVTGIQPAYWLIGSKNVKRLTDLKGKTLASNGLQTTATTAVVSILQRGANLLPERDYTFVSAGNAAARAAALMAGRIDGVAAAAPSAYRMIDEGYPVLAVERQYVPNYVQGTLAVNRDWAQKNRPLLVAILKTMLQSGRWLKDPGKRDEVIARLGEITSGSAKIGPDYARRIYADTVTQSGGVVESGYADRALFTATLNLLVERGLIAKTEFPPLDRLVDYTFLNAARRELGLREVKPL